MAEINMFEKPNIIAGIAKMVYYLVVQVAGEIHNSYGTMVFAHSFGFLVGGYIT